MAEKPPKKVPATSSQSTEDFYDSPHVCLDNVANLQCELNSISDLYAKEVLRVEQKYNELKKPLLQQRSDWIRNIPEFWLITLLNHPEMSHRITEQDEGALRSLLSVEVEEDANMKFGFKIRFFFRKNDYFENHVLTKEFMMDPYTNEAISEGVQIKWKPGKNLMQKSTVPDVASGSKRAVEECESFFFWFNDGQCASEDPVAEIIKEDLWPNPLVYYLDTNDSSLNEDTSQVEESDHDQNEGDVERNAKGENGGDETVIVRAAEEGKIDA